MARHAVAATLVAVLLCAAVSTAEAGLLDAFLSLFRPKANPFELVQHEQQQQDNITTGAGKNGLHFNRFGLIQTDNTCYSAKVPQNPRKQRILIALESFCPSVYDTKTESYCQHHERAFNSKCGKANLPIQSSLIRSITSDAAKKVKSTPKGLYKGAYTAWMRRLAPQMEAMGWANYHWTTFNSTRFWQKAQKADILIMSILNFRNVIRVYPNKRYILVQTNDASTLSFALGCNPADPRVLGILQHTALKPIWENNLRVMESRRHFDWLEPNLDMSNYRWRVPPLNKVALDKVHVAIPQIYRWRYPLDCGGHRPFARLLPAFKQEVDQWLDKKFYDRKYDVVFLGTINEGGSRDSGGVNDHRRAALTAIEALQKKYPHLRLFIPHHHAKTLGHLPYEHFLQILKDTKFFVSPFGLGEFSGKDYESILSGAILVKPYAHKLQSYPNIYNGTFVINMDLNFGDLEAKLMPYLEDCSRSAERGRCYSRREEIEERSRLNLAVLKGSVELDRLATRWDGLLFDMASRQIDMKCGRCMQTWEDKWMYTKQGVMKPLAELQEAAREGKREVPAWLVAKLQSGEEGAVAGGAAGLEGRPNDRQMGEEAGDGGNEKEAEEVAVVVEGGEEGESGTAL